MSALAWFGCGFVLGVAAAYASVVYAIALADDSDWPLGGAR